MSSTFNIGMAAGFSMLGSSQASSDIQNRANASLFNITSALKLRNTQATIFEAQDREITERLGQQLTATDLETVKAKGRLKAAQAETGTSGGTSDLVIAESYVIGARNREVQITSARDQKLDVARRNIMSRLDSDNRVSSYIQDIPSASAIRFSVFGAAIQGANQGYQLGSTISTGISDYNKASELKEQNNILKWETDNPSMTFSAMSPVYQENIRKGY